MTLFGLILTAGAGLVVLLFGRQLFWLFVGVLGFVIGFELASTFLASSAEWLIIVIALVAGVVGALLAVFLQYVTVGLAGFLAGGYVMLLLWRMLEVSTAGWVGTAVAIVGGIVGAILLLVVFDWALVVLSSLLGATILMQLADLEAPWQTLAFLGLFLVGVLVQGAMLIRARRSGRAPRRVVVRRERQVES